MVVCMQQWMTKFDTNNNNNLNEIRVVYSETTCAIPEDIIMLYVIKNEYKVSTPTYTP